MSQQPPQGDDLKALVLRGAQGLGPLEGLLRASGSQDVLAFVRGVLESKRVDLGDPLEVSLGTAAALNLWMLATGNLGAVRAVLDDHASGTPLEIACARWVSGQGTVAAMKNQRALLVEAKKLMHQLWREQQSKVVPAETLPPPPEHAGHRMLRRLA